ncbi:helix-turn-helix domain-containing protein, partial [Coprobacillus cateniformis]|nr:helix-turn-helix domain-containing protein [Coprobacillus cateniformis]
MKTKIKELRKINKVSQDELALAVGVTRQTIISL